MDNKKLTKADIDAVRSHEGFPSAIDENVIAISDAPYYTACPNPFIEEFFAENGKPYDEVHDIYHCEPFTADVSEGKTDPIYMAHSYHTKVPYKAIMRYILHYTSPGDVVLDGFCGSGMTGVAAKMCAKGFLDKNLAKNDQEFMLGARNAVLSDLSPEASLIAYVLNNKIDADAFLVATEKILSDCKKKCDWLYRTLHNVGGDKEQAYGSVNYIVLSDVLICPHCGKEIVFWDVALNKTTKRIDDEFCCQCCGTKLNKKECEHAMTVFYDDIIEDSVSMIKQIPVLINYTWNGKRYEKQPDKYDFDMLKDIEQKKIPYWVPVRRMPDGEESRRNDRFGITHIHHFFTKRTLYVLACLYNEIRDYKCDITLKNALMLSFTGILQISSKQSAFRYDSRNINNTAGGILKGTLYIPSIVREGSIFANYDRRVTALYKMAKEQEKYGEGKTLVQVCSATDTGIPSNSIDYIFTDPPFGSNINYSELSFVWEAWLGVETDNCAEAIINSIQHKGVKEYQALMTQCFTEYNRVLKPNRWMTVEFHNSKNVVWNAIQESLQRAGFIVADVRTLDKKQGSFKQVNNSSAVKQDLVISAYKPRNELIVEFKNNSGTVETAWAFVRQHLSNIPVMVVNGGKIEIISERQGYLLFDRMVAYHIIQGIPVPIDAADFYRGLDEKFLKRDGMYFLPDQVNEYDTARIKMDIEPVQLSFVVTNEKTAIGWLYQQLNEPKTYADIQPSFMKQVKTIDKYEAIPELSVLLEENFLQDEFSRWYIPDVTKEGDVIKLREKRLLKEFEGYMHSTGKLKMFRSEAVRVGFSMLWKDKNYQAIVDMAQRLPEATIQEDPNLLMYYDISLSRI